MVDSACQALFIFPFFCQLFDDGLLLNFCFSFSFLYLVWLIYMMRGIMFAVDMALRFIVEICMTLLEIIGIAIKFFRLQKNKFATNQSNMGPIF